MEEVLTLEDNLTHEDEDCTELFEFDVVLSLQVKRREVNHVNAGLNFVKCLYSYKWPVDSHQDQLQS